MLALGPTTSLTQTSAFPAIRVEGFRPGLGRSLRCGRSCSDSGQPVAPGPVRMNGLSQKAVVSILLITVLRLCTCCLQLSLTCKRVAHNWL